MADALSMTNNDSPETVIDMSRSTSHLLVASSVNKHARRRAERKYRRLLVLSDVLAVSVGVFAAQFIRFQIFHVADPTPVLYFASVFSVGLIVIWLLILALHGAWRPDLCGKGPGEFRRITNASFVTFATVAVFGLLAQQQIARGYLGIALPLGFSLLLVGRLALRRWLAARRRRGAHCRDVVVIGDEVSAKSLCASLSRDPSSGYRVIGVCLPAIHRTSDSVTTELGRIPVLGDENTVEAAVSLSGADTVAVSAMEVLGHRGVKRLAWSLEKLDVDMIVVPAVTDIAVPLLRIEPVDHLPLVHVGRPIRSPRTRFAKRVFDLTFCAVALVLLAPVMVCVAVAIKLDSRGPVLFRQVRVGRGGTEFRIAKFRTMTHGADKHLESARTAAGQNDQVFYKSAADARITRIGRVLRRTSLDELPQFFNVLGGTMSIVGPRPLVPGEGGSVEHFLERRGLMKPGITGLWQVSGRSDLDDDDRIRFDHLYVDNWSLTGDIFIVWRTVRAVLAKEGAY
ncbi:sugar transferase [Gordonia sp. VNK1]|uniref:sugar transferase n=1 Tax=Gordonia oleivorans TaxID=3156618 RepID=UPI0032B57EF3